MAEIVEDGGVAADGLVALLAALEVEGPTVQVVDMFEQGLDTPTQESLIAILRRRAPVSRPIIFLSHAFQRDPRFGWVGQNTGDLDLVLMDIQLSVLDGYESTRRIKAPPGMARTPVIAVSSFAMKGDEEKARAAGCDAYVTKPYSPKQLVDRVRLFLPKA
jgi:CheY-like chemotaxis protein